MARRMRPLVWYVNNGEYRHDRHERLLRTDDSLINFLDSMYDLDELGVQVEDDVAERRARTRFRVECLVALQALYRARLRAGAREDALEAALAFRDYVVNRNTDRMMRLFFGEDWDAAQREPEGVLAPREAH
jgi:hypothetical protein